MVHKGSTKVGAVLKRGREGTQVPIRPVVPTGDVPDFLPVVCGDQLGTFDVHRMCIRLKEGGREVSPTEFERLAGKAASKKWKASIRIDKVSSSSSSPPSPLPAPSPAHSRLAVAV